jgi:hypothetical protein
VKAKKRLRQLESRIDALEGAVWAIAPSPQAVELDRRSPIVEGMSFDTGGWSADEDEGWRRYGVYL